MRSRFREFLSNFVEGLIVLLYVISAALWLTVLCGIITVMALGLRNFGNWIFT